MAATSCSLVNSMAQTLNDLRALGMGLKEEEPYTRLMLSAELLEIGKSRLSLALASKQPAHSAERESRNCPHASEQTGAISAHESPDKTCRGYPSNHGR